MPYCVGTQKGVRRHVVDENEFPVWRRAERLTGGGMCSAHPRQQTQDTSYAGTVQNRAARHAGWIACPRHRFLLSSIVRLLSRSQNGNRGGRIAPINRARALNGASQRLLAI